MSKPRVTFIVDAYPQISETYQKVELEALRDRYDLSIISLREPDLTYRKHLPYETLSRPEEILEAIEDFKPHVLHTHWLRENVLLVADVARRSGTPFTVRSHSFDTIWPEPSRLRRVLGRDHVPGLVRNELAPLVNDDLCLGVLAFPHSVPRLAKAGVREEKLRACYPAMDYELFHARGPNGDAVMNVGAALPKKAMEDFVRLAASMPGVEFNLYALGYEVEALKRVNHEAGDPVKLIDPVEPDEMPGEYKRHRWLVYTASKKMATIGWPVAVAEAQASGVGVCAANVRPDLREYVGPGGFLYDSLAEAREIISKPFPEEMRELGFEHARKADIRGHISTLTDLWEPALDAQAPQAASR